MSADLFPTDAYNRQLVDHVHPVDWKPPSPAPHYDLVVLGAGTAGLVTAAGAAGLGARVALVERGLMGGDCLNVGCVPSKALIRAARAAAEVRQAAAFGVRLEGHSSVDFPAIMERMRRLRAELSEHDSARRFQEDLGVDVFLGQAIFTAPDQVQVDTATLRFRKAVIATGARPAHPGIPGLEGVGYLTNETVFNLTQLPVRLGVLGGGPIGCELAQAFARFGVRVTLIHRHQNILEKEDPEAARLIATALERDGVELMLEANVTGAEPSPGGKCLHIERGETRRTLEVDELLVGVGRQPNVEGLELDKAKVAYDLKRGVHVDDHLRTSNPRIFAAGDICTRYKFTHAADAMARLVIGNSLFAPLGKWTMGRASQLLIPRVTYTSPELATVGLTQAEATAAGVAYTVFTQPLTKVDRAVLDGETEGFLQLLVGKGNDRILGATLVAQHAGESISEITLAMQNKLGLRKLASVIHPYPTQAEAIRKIADAWNRTRLTPLTKWLLRQIKG